MLTWQETESRFDLKARALKARGVAAGRVGIEETVRFVFADGMAPAASAIRVVSARPVFSRPPRVRGFHELKLKRLASEVTLNAYAATYLGLRNGMTPTEYGALVSGTASVWMATRGRTWWSTPCTNGRRRTLKPGIYISGEFGLWLEDDMVVTENVAALFTPQSPSIDDPFTGPPAASFRDLR